MDRITIRRTADTCLGLCTQFKVWSLSVPEEKCLEMYSQALRLHTHTRKSWTGSFSQVTCDTVNGPTVPDSALPMGLLCPAPQPRLWARITPLSPFRGLTTWVLVFSSPSSADVQFHEARTLSPACDMCYPMENTRNYFSSRTQLSDARMALRIQSTHCLLVCVWSSAADHVDGTVFGTGCVWRRLTTLAHWSLHSRKALQRSSPRSSEHVSRPS
ncbi:hypothetical protein MJT46_018209 [Ovis ammon polii x Ovis aries]|nr:hypothetical protein MJT46_018209 [Ovis ammon polii x Ovis aries]